MKKATLIIFATIFLAIPFLSFGQQETSAKENNNTDPKISYALINEYGFFLGGTFGFTGVFVNGIRFNKTQDMLGIGIGYEADTRSSQSVPLFVNFRHYFQGKRALKPLFNIGIGARISFWTESIGYYVPYEYDGYTYEEWYWESKQRVTPGLYATIAAGFKVKAFSFTSGFFLKSWNKEYFGGVEVKAGFTF
jgi:hypothetical protein